MKTSFNSIRKSCLLISMVLQAGLVAAQSKGAATIGVLNIETAGVIPDAQALGNMVRLELEKTKTYNVLDAFDIRDVMKKNDLDMNACFGKSCVVEAGKLLHADKMMLGNVERYGEKIVITLKVINVSTGEIEKSGTQEFLNLQNEIQKMVEISVMMLVGLTPDPDKVSLLIAYDQPIESPQTRMNLSGPRIGTLYMDGPAGKLLRGAEKDGGFNMYPVSSQIGWQQEVQYLSSGNFSALLEFLFMAGGIESGRFIPSFSGLLGFRMGKQGWEFAVGPSFKIIRKADGYYTADANGKLQWNLAGTSVTYDTTGAVQHHSMTTRLDSRGEPAFTGGLVLAVGRTFKSGYLNIPVNAFFVPRKEGCTYGISVGFNIYKK